MKKIYGMIVHGDASGFWGEFPDLPGCFTDGVNFDSLMKNAADALASYLENLAEHGKEFPSASDPAEFKKKTVIDDSALFVVPMVGYLPEKPARINVTSTAAKIDEITDYAKKHKQTRSELMIRATLNFIRSNR